MPIPGWGTSGRVRGTMSERGEIEGEAVETIERASEGAGVQLDVKLGRGRAQLLQVSAAEKHTPWYREARGIVSALALTVSAASLAYAWRSDGAAEIRQKRQEIRQIVQELTEMRSEEHTSELQSLAYLVCRLLLEKKKKNRKP